VRDCRGRDMKEDGCTEQYVADSLLASPSRIPVSYFIFVILKGRAAYVRGNSDGGNHGK